MPFVAALGICNITVGRDRIPRTHPRHLQTRGFSFCSFSLCVFLEKYRKSVVVASAASAS